MRAAALVLAGGLLVAGPLVAASPASAAEVARPDVTVPALPGVPAAALLAHGRVLVLRPGSLEIALDGRVRRTVAVRQPLDLTQLPALVGDPSYAVRTAPDGLLLGAVLLQRPGTRVVASGVRLELADTGGAGPARLTGTRAAVDLSGVTVTASSALGVAATPGARIVTAGLRYLHDSDVRLQDVVLRGLGTPGRAGLPAVRAGGGSRVRLTGITLEAGGRGVQLDQPGPLDIEGLTADHATGDVIRVVGGSGARLSGIRTTGTAGAAVRLRATIGTTLTGLSSTGDTRALIATDVDGLDAAGVSASGSGLLVGGRRVELVSPRVDAPAVALQVEGATGVVVHGGSLRGTAAVRADAQSMGVRLEGVTTRGRVTRSVGVYGGTVDDPARAAAPAATPAHPAAAGEPWWAARLRGAGAVALVVLGGGLLLEVLRGRRRDGRTAHRDAGVVTAADGSPDDGLALDLGEAGRL